MGFAIDRETLLFLRDLVQRHSGIYLSHKEVGLLETRVAGRLRELALDSIGEYLGLLEGPEADREVRALLDAVTVNYTSFFRDIRQFQLLCAEVLPRLLAVKEQEETPTIRVWSAGCSTGEEPYSVAVCFAEVCKDPERHDIRILATDINGKVLKTAARGVYPHDRLAGFPKEHLYKYWTRDASTPEGCLRLCPEIREMVVFRRFNILRDAKPLKAQLDLILCRNVMMYFDEKTRARLVRKFYRYLTRGGYLFIGESEILVDPARMFDRFGPSIYRKP